MFAEFDNDALMSSLYAVRKPVGSNNNLGVSLWYMSDAFSVLCHRSIMLFAAG